MNAKNAFRRRSFHVFGGVCLALFLAACEGTGEGQLDEPDDSTPSILFAEDFSSGNLLDNWVMVREGESGTVVSDPSFGNPVPSAWFSRPTDATRETAPPKLASSKGFTAAGGLTIRFDAATRAAGSILVRVVGVAGQGACGGYVEILPKKVHYFLRNGGLDLVNMHAINSDTDFHTFEFTLSPAGALTWRRDGEVQQGMEEREYSGCLVEFLMFKIEADVTNFDDVEGASFNLDNILVTRP